MLNNQSTNGESKSTIKVSNSNINADILAKEQEITNSGDPVVAHLKEPLARRHTMGEIGRKFKSNVNNLYD